MANIIDSEQPLLITTLQNGYGLVRHIQKAFVAIVLMMIFLLCGSFVYPKAALAEEAIAIDDVSYVYHVVDGSSVVVTGIYSDEVVNVKIPEKINGLFVTEIHIKGNGTNKIISSLDVSQCSKLKELVCFSKNLTALNTSGLTALKKVDCSYGNLISLDVSGCKSLTMLDCSWNNELSFLRISGLISLSHLDCSNNNLTSLDVSGLTSLRSFYCRSNNLDSINLSDLTNLEYFDCGLNRLKLLDVSKLTSLKSLIAPVIG